MNVDESDILVQNSDNDHSDNDWLVVVWSINGIRTRTDTIPLKKANGSGVLHHGDTIPPFVIDIACEDGDFGSAAFTIVTLGSLDLADQQKTIVSVGKTIANCCGRCLCGFLNTYVTATHLFDVSAVVIDSRELLRNIVEATFMTDVLDYSVCSVIDIFLKVIDETKSRPPAASKRMWPHVAMAQL